MENIRRIRGDYRELMAAGLFGLLAIIILGLGAAVMVEHISRVPDHVGALQVHAAAAPQERNAYWTRYKRALVRCALDPVRSDAEVMACARHAADLWFVDK